MAATLSRPQYVYDHLLYDTMQCRYNPVIFFKSSDTPEFVHKGEMWGVICDFSV